MLIEERKFETRQLKIYFNFFRVYVNYNCPDTKFIFCTEFILYTDLNSLLHFNVIYQRKFTPSLGKIIIVFCIFRPQIFIFAIQFNGRFQLNLSAHYFCTNHNDRVSTTISTKHNWWIFYLVCYSIHYIYKKCKYLIRLLLPDEAKGKDNNKYSVTCHWANLQTLPFNTL